MDLNMEKWNLDASTDVLYREDREIIRLNKGWGCQPDVLGFGVFLTPPRTSPAAYQEHPLGQVATMARFTSLYRFSPFWTRPAVGDSEKDVQPETLWLLSQTTSGHFTLLVPLLDKVTRYSMRAQDQTLMVVAETGDPSVPCGHGPALFVASGDDPYALLSDAARSITQHLGVGRRREDKALPSGIDDFGWCTWDAFYKEVTPEKVLQSLEGFRQAGVSPRWMILDDGWQSWQSSPCGEDLLTSMAANDGFGGNLSALIGTAKKKYGIRHFMVWHALLGYWGGLSPESFAAYGVRMVPRQFGPGVLAHEPRWNVHPWGTQQGVPAAEEFGHFYADWHSALAAQGVDGVKVDAQAMLESVSAGQGGRVVMTKASKAALEDSVGKHFEGRLINCMACGSEGAYLSHDSVVMRTSDDFFPQRPDSHGLHLFTNAVAGLWWGEFMLPDWDMFHSSHSHGSFHAVARAVSGGPVYVSDGIGMHDAAVLKKLVLSDGSVLRADFPGRPSPDVLMADPTQDAVLLKVFNRNQVSGVVALFHAGRGSERLVSCVSLADVPVLSTAPAYVAWAHQLDRLWLCDEEPSVPIELGPAQWEIVSFAPIEHGVAVLGLADKFNSTGAVVSRHWSGARYEVRLRDGGEFLAWAWQKPVELSCEGMRIPYAYDEQTGRLQCHLPTGGPRKVLLSW